jgi:rRNA maturation endonuclease Nob1
MGLLTMLGLAAADNQQSTTTTDTPTPGKRARCRGCGRYYDLQEDTCPHCGSGNKIRSGAPRGQTRV